VRACSSGPSGPVRNLYFIGLPHSPTRPAIKITWFCSLRLVMTCTVCMHVYALTAAIHERSRLPPPHPRNVSLRYQARGTHTSEFPSICVGKFSVGPDRRVHRQSVVCMHACMYACIRAHVDTLTRSMPKPHAADPTLMPLNHAPFSHSAQSLLRRLAHFLLCA
jgi:hypothetical protein